MDALVKEILLLGLTKGSYDNVVRDEAGGVDGLTATIRDMSIEGKSLVLAVQQIRVMDKVTGALRSVYPSNVDLVNLATDNIDVIREGS
jgi:hypothetical protein